MENKRNVEKTNKLNDLLCEVLILLADNQDILKEKECLDKTINTLESIYIHPETRGYKFRHAYSRIYATLHELYLDGKCLDIVVQNINVLYKECANNGKIELAEKLYKLLDHVSLDVARIPLIQNAMKKVDDQIIQSEHDLKQLQQETKEWEEEIKKGLGDIHKTQKITKKTKNKIDRTVNNLYSQMASVIGVFAAIVIVFFGGTSLFSEIFKNSVVHQINWMMVAPSLCLIGMVVFNVIFMFLYILAKLLNKTIYTKSYDHDKWYIRWVKKYPYVFAFNFFMIVVWIICA